MCGDGFTEDGLAALDAALARHTTSGAVPGLVALVARGGQVHVTSAGHKAIGDAAPIGREAIFRIASLTKPITGVAAMLLIEDGAMALSDPVERWLPELGGRRVLRSPEAELSDTGRWSLASSSNGSPGHRSLRCSASGCSSRSA
jgi:CubicO group peptidase (beta-lactamase class C family)